MKRLIIVLSIAVVALAGCAPSQAAIEKAIAQTETAKPTNTLMPTETLMPTKPPVQNKTWIPTATTTLRPTSTKVPTKKPTNTPAPTVQPYFQTRTAVADFEGRSSKFEDIVIKEFITYPKNYENKLIKLNCKVFNVISDDQFQCWIPGTYDSYFVFSANKYNDIYEDDILKILAVGAGEHCGKNAFGGEVCQPIVVMDSYIHK